MNMVLIASRDGRRSQELLKALRAAGAHSATISHGEGFDFFHFRGVRGSLDAERSSAGPGVTIMALVPDALTQGVVETAEQALVGHSGMVCAFPLGHFASYQGETRADARGDARREARIERHQEPRNVELTRRFA
jgi:hypothetical protein